MFHFPGCPPHELCIHSWVTGHYSSRVPPFGNLRINAYLRLPPAYRSLSRPSSAISAMASTLRSYSLDLLPNLHPTLLRLLRGQMKALVLSIVSCCFNSFLCSFQGAIEVLFSSLLSWVRNFKTIQKLFSIPRRHSDSLRLSPAFLPVFLRLCFLLEAFYLYDQLRISSLLSYRPWK